MKILTLMLSLAAAPGAAQEAAPSQTSEMREQYDKAFGYYVAGDYSKAIEYWNLVLRTDPKQVTARNMIEEARQKMAGTSATLKSAFAKLLERGRYAEALMKLEEMLASDPTSPHYQKLQGKLRKIADLAPQKPSSSRAWTAAGEAIAAWLSEKEDLAFAYDALRYAAELAPGDKTFPRLVRALEEESPQLKLNDTKPENTPVLEHKKEMALHHIYDSKFYLAVKELEGVLRLDPNDVTALKRAGSAYVQLKDYKQARQAWQKALKLSPEDEQLKEYLEALDRAAQQAPQPAKG